MKAITRLGTFDDVLADATPDVAKICLTLRDLIGALHPDCVEVPRPGEHSSAYGFGEKKMSEAYAYIMPQAEYANLGFFHGVNILLGNPSLEGTGKKLRHIKVRSEVAANSPEVRKALIDAIQERRDALGITTR